MHINPPIRTVPLHCIPCTPLSLPKKKKDMKLFIYFLLLISVFAFDSWPQQGEKRNEEEGTDMETFDPPGTPPPHPDCEHLWNEYDTVLGIIQTDYPDMQNPSKNSPQLLALLEEMCGKYCLQNIN